MRICGASAHNCAGIAEVLCRLSSFHSIPFRFVSFRAALMASPMALQFLLQCKNVFATCEIEWLQRRRRRGVGSPTHLSGRGPHCSLAVAFYCLLLGVSAEQLPAAATASLRLAMKYELCVPPKKKKNIQFACFKWQAAANIGGIIKFILKHNHAPFRPCKSRKI